MVRKRTIFSYIDSAVCLSNVSLLSNLDILCGVKIMLSTSPLIKPIVLFQVCFSIFSELAVRRSSVCIYLLAASREREIWVRGRKVREYCSRGLGGNICICRVAGVIVSVYFGR
jgi:hypothetical protein